MEANTTLTSAARCEASRLRVCQESGFTLMEVLITVVILSIGLLGLAGLQFHSVRGNHNAYLSTLAVIQAMGAADRLRANPAGVAAGAYNNLTGTASDPGCITSTDGCSSAQLAQYDYWVWEAGRAPATGDFPDTGNARLLPGGEGVICRDSTPNDGTSKSAHSCDNAQTDGMDVFAIKIWWDDDRDPTSPSRYYFMSVAP